MAIIVVLTAAFVLSAVSGVHKGIQWLSNTNMGLAGLLLLFLLVAGPTVFIFDTLTEAVGGYLTSIVPNSFRTGAFGDREWLGDMDDLLLGVVDLVGAVRRHVHRAHLARAGRSASSCSACC